MGWRSICEITGNDYVGKGWAAARSPCGRSRRRVLPHQSVILGNTALYGERRASCWLQAWRRVVLSAIQGATAVIEGGMKALLRV